MSEKLHKPFIQNSTFKDFLFYIFVKKHQHLQRMNKKYQMLAILGPTASGKTSVAVHVALNLDGEVISADSRQVYRGMDIGTGKDSADYTVDEVSVPCHLTDILDAGEKYNVFRYQNDFLRVYNDIISRKKFPILCGGSGLYIESVLKKYHLTQVPKNQELRKKLQGKSIEELIEILKQEKKDLHNTTDFEDTRRAIRAIEIENYIKNHPLEKSPIPKIKTLIVGIKSERDIRRQRITDRLKARLKEGMVEEVENLLKNGIPPEQLTYYGLEYKFVTLYITGQIDYKEMYQRLEIAIHQFSKRQMTWFRGMERRGIPIHWIDSTIPLEQKMNLIKNWLTE